MPSSRNRRETRCLRFRVNVNESESLQRAIREDVRLCPTDASWPKQFAEERERLLGLFPSQLQGVEHIGSTAIPGIPAKPIIDILAAVESMAVADRLTEPLLASGYTTSVEFNATLKDRRWFMRWAQGRRTHHLHLVVAGSDEWHRRLRFRDALRADQALADRYAALKRTLAQLHGANREAYTRGKAAFVNRVIDSR